jgi:hypothetical protein
VERSGSRELILERLVRRGVLQAEFRKMKVCHERSIEMGRDLIERAFVKFRDEREKEARGPVGEHGRINTVRVEPERLRGRSTNDVISTASAALLRPS